MENLLKTWFFWVFLVVAGLIGYKLILWMLKTNKVTAPVGKTLEGATDPNSSGA